LIFSLKIMYASIAALWNDSIVQRQFLHYDNK
jgi:hypothetical protein